MSNVHKFQPRKPGDKQGKRPLDPSGRQPTPRLAGPKVGRPESGKRNAVAVMIGIGVLIGVSMLVGQIGF